MTSVVGESKELSNGLPGLSVRRPWLATVANLLIVLAGLAAALGIDIRELPNVDRPIVSVRANYPGASPTTVDAEVTSIVEGAVARVEGLVSVSSSSEEGNFRLRAEFRPSRDLNTAANDVREAVSRAQRRLPEGIRNLRVVKSEQDANPVLNVAVWSTTVSIDQLTRRVVDTITPELTGIDGVADVTRFGGRHRVLRVEVDPERLSAFGFAIGEIANVLRRVQFDVPVGSFEAGELEVLVRADASVVEPEKIRELVISDSVRLGDVAQVYFGTATPESIARLSGRNVLDLGIIRQAGSNTIQISEDVNRTLDRLRQAMPELGFEITNDDAVFIKGAISEVLFTLTISLLIVVFVIWLFTGSLSATLVPALAIPVALIGSLAMIWLMGYSLNLVTLLALVLATGLVVDDAIVVLENIQKKQIAGYGRRAAAVIGTKEVFFAVIATTATLVAVFIPISFLPSQTGRVFSEFGFVLASTIIISSFVALTLCPMIASVLPVIGGHKLQGKTAESAGKLYWRFLTAVLNARIVAVFVSLLLAGLAAFLYSDLGEELVPKEDRGGINIWMQGPDGVGLDHTDRQVQKVEEMLQPWIDQGAAESAFSITGRYDLNRGQVRARLVPWSERNVSQADIEADLRPKLSQLAGAQARIFGGNSLGLWRAGSGLQIALTGPNYDDIANAAFSFADQVAKIDGLSDTRVQYQATQPQLSIKIDRSRISDLGVDMGDMSSTLRALVDEEELTELTIGDQRVPIILESKSGSINDPADLLNLSIRTADGNLVRLSQIVTLQEGGVAAELDRHGQRRAIEIYVSKDPELSLRDAVEEIQALATEQLPDDIGLLLLGEAATLEETSSDLAITFLIALIIVFLVLLAQFESFTSALIVIFIVPFGLACAVFALWLTGVTLNVYSQIGVLLLVGIMAKNSILLVEFADQLRDAGVDAWTAARKGAQARLRPILMTLASTILAALPLILSTGPGSEARAAIGWVIFGGLGLAVGFTLFLAPCLYSIVAGVTKPRAASGNLLDEELAAVGRQPDI